MSCPADLFYLGDRHTNYADPNKQVKSNKNEILDSVITKIHIIIKPFTNYERRKKYQNLINLGPQNPHRLAYSNYTHTLIIADVDHFNEKWKILIEYGGYDYRRDGDYEGQVHFYYPNGEGLRFVKLTDNDIKYLQQKGNHVVQCDVLNQITVDNLIFDSQFCGTHHVWKYDYYDPLRQNCQLFVRKAVKILGATRIFDIQKETYYSKKYIPYKVASALSDNEKYGNTINSQILSKISQEKFACFEKYYRHPFLEDSCNENVKFQIEKIHKFSGNIFDNVQPSIFDGLYQSLFKYINFDL